MDTVFPTQMALAPPSLRIRILSGEDILVMKAKGGAQIDIEAIIKILVAAAQLGLAILAAYRTSKTPSTDEIFKQLQKDSTLDNSMNRLNEENIKRLIDEIRNKMKK